MRLKSQLLLMVAITAPSMGCHRAVRGEPTARGSYVEEGTASYYGTEFRGRRTANGERFNPEEFTAAHRTLRFGTCLWSRICATELASRCGSTIEVRMPRIGSWTCHRRRRASSG